MKKQILFIAIIMLLFGCGSGFYSEVYEIHTTQNDFVRKVDSLKNTHPEYKWYNYDKDWNVINSDGCYAPYEKSGTHNLLFYTITFNISSENKLFNCQIIPYDSLDHTNSFTIRFIAVIDPVSGMRYAINTCDLCSKDNAKYKSLFEKQILDSLNVKWNK